MADTRQLIEQLAAHATPVRVLASPLRRALSWIALAAAIVAVAVANFGLRPDLIVALSTPAVALEWSAAVLTGLLAAYAVFQISVPGRSPRWAWLPVPALILWLSSVGLGCFGDWLHLGPQAFAIDSSGWHCMRAISLISLPSGLVLLVMVRHAGVLRPASTALLGALSAAALSAAGVSLFHPGESALMVLVWHLGAVALLSALGWVLSGRLFAWIGYGHA